MGRTAKDRTVNQPKPVEKVELSEKHVGLRFAIVAALIIVAVISFGYGIHSLLTVEAGWTEIEADSSADTNVGNEFVLMYNLGSRSDMSITAENKGIISTYTDVMVKAYELFHNNQEIENVKNIYYINQNPNEEIEVDDMLYQAFSLVQEYGDRTIYLAPIYEQYNNIFYCEDDSQIVDFDPYSNVDVALAYAEMAKYAGDEAAINVELLGNNKIKLYVSEEYLEFCDENGITSYIDFAWMRNAFVVDYVAETLISQGYTEATISSYDGFSRNLDDSETEFSFNIYDKNSGDVYQVAIMQYSGVKNIVTMRNYPMNTLDVYRYYELSNGDIRTSYLDVSDGLCKSATTNLYSYSEDLGCAEILLQIASIYVSEELDKEALANLKDSGIYSIYVEEEVIVYNEKALILSDIYKSNEFVYTTNYME